jgi:glycine cleavage system pyridoxal-binding protein P
MLKTIGAATLDQLIDETIPSDIRLNLIWIWNQL